MHHAYTFWMDTQHFQAKILQIKQIWHISQAKVHLQVGTGMTLAVMVRSVSITALVVCTKVIPKFKP